MKKIVFALILCPALITASMVKATATSTSAATTTTTTSRSSSHNSRRTDRIPTAGTASASTNKSKQKQQKIRRSGTSDTSITFASNSSISSSSSHQDDGKDILQTVRRGGEEVDEKIPCLLKPWVYSYRKVPSVLTLPVPRCMDIHDNSEKRRRMNVTFTFVCAILFACIDYFSAFVIRLAWGPALSQTLQVEARTLAGSITTIFHSSLLTVGLLSCFYNYETVAPTTVMNKQQKIPIPQTQQSKLSLFKYVPSSLMSDNLHSWWSDAATSLIQFCTGYMLYDAVVQFGLDKIFYHNGHWRVTDYLFLAHHALTAIYMISTLMVQGGHVSAMILMLAGEMTAPIMNILRISNTLKSSVMTADESILLHLTKDHTGFLQFTKWLTQTMHPHIEYVYAAFYFFIRAGVFPILAIYLTHDLIFTKEGRRNVPILISLVWMAMAWGVGLGSYPWVKQCWKILTSEHSGEIA